MTPEQAERWSRKRRLGRARFVLTTGILAWGISVTGLLTLWDWWAEGVTPTVAGVLTRSLVIGLAAGAVYGLLMWHWLEREFARACGPHGTD